MYVRDQSVARDFYARVLGLTPSLDVPGMTEFALVSGLTLGLMPSDGIAALITPALPHPDTGHGVPRCELYLQVDDVEAAYRHAIGCGAVPVSAPATRNWGHVVGYVADPEGHIIAFARPREN